MTFQWKIRSGTTPTISGAWFELPTGWSLDIDIYDDFEPGSALSDLYMVGDARRFSSSVHKYTKLVIDIDEHARRIYFTDEEAAAAGLLPAVGTDVIAATEEMAFYGSVYVKRST